MHDQQWRWWRTMKTLSATCLPTKALVEQSCEWISTPTSEMFLGRLHQPLCTMFADYHILSWTYRSTRDDPASHQVVACHSLPVIPKVKATQARHIQKSPETPSLLLEGTAQLLDLASRCLLPSWAHHLWWVHHPASACFPWYPPWWMVNSFYFLKFVPPSKLVILLLCSWLHTWIHGCIDSERMAGSPQEVNCVRCCSYKECWHER